MQITEAILEQVRLTLAEKTLKKHGILDGKTEKAIKDKKKELKVKKK